MLEKEFYSRLVKPFLESVGCCERIENAAMSGTPDISYSGGSKIGIKRNGFIETKIVYNDKLHFEIFQLAWFSRRLRHSPEKTLWIMTYNPKKFVIGLAEAETMIKQPRYSHAGFVVVEDNPSIYASIMPMDPRKDWHQSFSSLMFK
jgi:hypothetical protein